MKLKLLSYPKNKNRLTTLSTDSLYSTQTEEREEKWIA
jgi:hypothetical protein